MTDHPAPPPHLQVEGVHKRYGRFTALEDVSFRARKGEFICILGPSGCGKTTLLRVIAGLEGIDGGGIRREGRDIAHLPVSRRNVGIVFQSYALFPNLSARANVAYGLQYRGLPRREREGRVEELLALVGLETMGEKYPAQLSGGQQQRVALARAMALSPDLLLLDEPLSALDAKVRVMLRGEIRQLQRRLGVTTIMVTHDQEEALTMADRILIMDRGRLVQKGAPDAVYDRPATPFVADFIGAMNFIPGASRLGAGRYRLGSRELRVAYENGAAAWSADTPLTMGIRPEEVAVMAAAEAPNRLAARVESLEYRGPHFRLRLRLDLGGEAAAVVDADVPAEKIRRLDIREQMRFDVGLPPQALRVYRDPAEEAPSERMLP